MEEFLKELAEAVNKLGFEAHVSDREDGTFWVFVTDRTLDPATVHAVVTPDLVASLTTSDLISAKASEMAMDAVVDWVKPVYGLSG